MGDQDKDPTNPKTLHLFPGGMNIIHMDDQVATTMDLPRVTMTQYDNSQRDHTSRERGDRRLARFRATQPLDGRQHDFQAQTMAKDDKGMIRAAKEARLDNYTVDIR